MGLAEAHILMTFVLVGVLKGPHALMTVLQVEATEAQNTLTLMPTHQSKVVVQEAPDTSHLV